MNTIPIFWWTKERPSCKNHCLLEKENSSKSEEKLTRSVCVINALQEEFEEHDSEIETVARDCIGETVTYILDWFDIPIDTEEAIRERDW